MSLPTHELDKFTKRVDAELCRIAHTVSFVLAVTPANSDDVWRRFKKSNYDRLDDFSYRPLGSAAVTARGRLSELARAPLGGLMLEDLLRGEIERHQLYFEAVDFRGTARFRELSVQLYGDVEDELLKHARDVLPIANRRATKTVGAEYVDAEMFRAHAQQMIADYQTVVGDDEERCSVSTEVSGVMVNNGKLIIPSSLRLPRSRVDALLAHEVSTHVLTYLNARTQPLRVLSCGLTGYDELQEGLGVIGEYIVGGLTPGRMRTLAARVVAIHGMLDGATFVEVFRLLREQAQLGPRAAFKVTMRVFRGGGLTKDAVYLRGVLRLLDHFRAENDHSVLFVGKMAFRHIALVRRLIDERVLSPPPAMPNYWSDDAYGPRIRAMGHELSLADLIAQPASA